MSICIHGQQEHNCMWCEIPSIVLFCAIHRRNTTQRLGQFFCNLFIKNCDSDPDLIGLYYEQDEDKARETIKKWLVNKQYVYQLPQRVNDSYKNFI